MLVVLHFGELGVDHVVRLGRTARCGLRAGIGRAALCRGVQRLRHLLQLADLRLDRRLVVAILDLLQIGQGALDAAELIGRHLAAVLLQRAAGGVHQLVGLVAGGDQLVELLVLFLVRLGVGDHPRDLFLGQARAGLDLDLLLLAGLLVLGRHVQDAVRVDVEGDLDLRHAARRRLDALQVELAQRLVRAGALALALQHVHGHRGLVVVSGGEGLRRLGRHRGVLLDQLGHHAAHRLDAQRQRGDVEQQHVLDRTAQHAALDRRAHGNGFVRVDVLAWFLAEEVLHRLLHLRHAGLAADQDHVVDVGHAQAGVVQRGAARLDGALDQVFHQRFQLGAGQLDVEVLRAGRVGRHVRQVNVGLVVGGQLDLGALGGVLQALQRERVLAQVDALLLLELLDQVVDDAHVEVLATEEGVAVGGQHLELLLAVDFGDLDDRHVEGAAAQVVHRDLAVAAFLVQAIGQRGRGRLVDDALHFQAGDLAGVLGRLALAVVEVGRHRDHRLGDRLAEIVLGGLLHLHQHLGGDFLRRHLLAVGGLHPGVAVVVRDHAIGHDVQVLLHFLVGELAADQALHRVEGVLRVGHALALGRGAHQHLAVLGEGDDGRRGAIAFRVLDDLGRAAVHHGHAGVGRTQVDADDLAHVIALRILRAAPAAAMVSRWGSAWVIQCRQGPGCDLTMPAAAPFRRAPAMAPFSPSPLRPARDAAGDRSARNPSAAR
ncbi:putative NAD-specific glutamate dehydrogenase [Rhodanobacter thiooxydans LCS2]|nr:putative NAD-specific glutamate dehydrogenase [Rhodanobacter thiooxydans LCS2]